MPAETARLARPVGRRDRLAVAILLCACALAAVGTARAQGESPPPGRGCVQADVAGVLGGGTVRGCGRGAFAVCRVYAAASPSLAAQCARARPVDRSHGNP